MKNPFKSFTVLVTTHSSVIFNKLSSYRAIFSSHKVLALIYGNKGNYFAIGNNSQLHFFFFFDLIKLITCGFGYKY